MSVKCMLHSSATHSFVHPRIVQLTEAKPSEGDVLAVTVGTGTKVFCKDICMLDLMFTVEGRDCQVTISLQLYVLDGSQSDVILGMVFLK